MELDTAAVIAAVAAFAGIVLLLHFRGESSRRQAETKLLQLAEVI